MALNGQKLTPGIEALHSHEQTERLALLTDARTMSVVRFYQLEAQKILADGEKISLFTKHPGTLGAYREARLREFLGEHIPTRFVVTSGFITDHDREQANQVDRSSLQIDCLVHDHNHFAPLFRTDEFAIVSPAPVVAIVEVKSSLTLSKETLGNDDPDMFVTPEGRRYQWAGSLVEALTNIKSAIDVMEEASICRGTYFTGIIAYSANSLPQLVSAMTSGQVFEQLGITDLDQLPDCICILDGSAWTFSMCGEAEPEKHGMGDTDPTYSYAVEFPRTDEGSALQMFTAFFDHAMSVQRMQQDHTIGGMRSGAGYEESTVSHLIPVSSPRQHGEKCCSTVLEDVGSVASCTRR